MSSTTPEYWSIDGVSLNTFAFNIATSGGDRLAPPTFRGGNISIPHTPGSRWVPKEVDSRIMSLGMWVVGSTEDGERPSGSPGAEFDKNFRMLRSLFWNPKEQFTLTKRFFINGSLKTASAQAQFRSGLNPTMNGRARGVFSVDIELADPYFYGEDVITTLTTGTQNVVVEGDATTRLINSTIFGSRTNPKIKNNTLNVDFSYQGSLLSGAKLDIDVPSYVARTTPSGGVAYTSSGSIRHTGAPAWMQLSPGINSVTLSSDSGIGVVTMTHKAAWF